MQVTTKEKTYAGFKSRLAKARRKNRVLMDRRSVLVKELVLIDRELDQQKKLIHRLEDGAV
jgi:hypothetical protein